MITAAIKQRLLEKFNNQCVKCKGTSELTIDHIVPRWMGGYDNIENLQILCWNCNQRKGNIPPVWIRIKHMFSGFFYRFINEVKADNQGNVGLMKEELKRVFQSWDDQLKHLEKKIDAKPINNTAAIMPKLNLLEFEVKLLKTENLQLKERLKGLEDYEKIGWVEKTIKEYRKLNGD